MHLRLLGKRPVVVWWVLTLLATCASTLSVKAQDSVSPAIASQPAADVASPATDEVDNPVLSPATVTPRADVASETHGVSPLPAIPLPFSETGEAAASPAAAQPDPAPSSNSSLASPEATDEPAKTETPAVPTSTPEPPPTPDHEEKHESVAGPHDKHETDTPHETMGKHEAAAHGAHGEGAAGAHYSPPLWAVAPFVILLLCIAILPLIHRVEHWWHHNKNKFIIAAALAIVTLLYYLLRSVGFHADPGLPSVKMVLQHAVLDEYIPFIILLFCLYTISGGIQLRGDLRARPATNAAFLGLGAVLASFIGTTGASMLLIRPLLQINQERKHVRHTVIFFIFLVSNIGGSLLPTGDPPLFLGYLFGVPFLWTLNLWKAWLFAVCVLLVVYWIWDTLAYRRETVEDRMLDATQIEPLRIRGSLNFLWLLCVVLAVAVMVPGKELPGTSFAVPDFLREAVMLAFVGLAWMTTSPQIRKENNFDFCAITEVAVLFIGIFITMQVPIEILNAKGPELGLTKPWQFFWATGTLSSFLDNAPTYVVYFKTAGTLAPEGMAMMGDVDTFLKTIPIPLLVGISLGAVFMGANTYIGNGPNFMVKSIAEQSGIKMPSFFGYMLYSIVILIPLFLLITVIFLM
ncbi:MAG TPA: sodium:proton antiporter [Phycisphaerae bacterium]|nr:sodium:proton antiporter [Phycisphaerae bacterium]